MQGRTDKEVMTDRQLIPRNPFEVEATKAIVQRHIEAGDITQGDIDLMKSAYAMMGTISFVSSCILGGGSYFYMKKRVPHWGIGQRLLMAGGLGGLGSFAGIAIGGVGASMEIKSKMQDPERKMKVMADIALESKRAIEEARFGRGPGIEGAQPTQRGTYDSASGDPKFDAEGYDERRREDERERGMRNEVGRIEGDSANEERRYGQSQGRGIADSVKKETGSAWEKIRLDRPTVGSTSSSSGSSMSSSPNTGYQGYESNRGLGGGMRGPTSDEVRGEDTRSREQREFDELLEKERKGVDATDTWK